MTKLQCARLHFSSPNFGFGVPEKDSGSKYLADVVHLLPLTVIRFLFPDISVQDYYMGKIRINSHAAETLYAHGKPLDTKMLL